MVSLIAGSFARKIKNVTCIHITFHKPHGDRSGCSVQFRVCIISFVKKSVANPRCRSRRINDTLRINRPVLLAVIISRILAIQTFCPVCRPHSREERHLTARMAGVLYISACKGKFAVLNRSNSVFDYSEIIQKNIRNFEKQLFDSDTELNRCYISIHGNFFMAIHGNF